VLEYPNDNAPSEVYLGFADSADRTHVDAEVNSAVIAGISYAVDYQQQYLAKNPDGYCGLKGHGSFVFYWWKRRGSGALRK
jgi:peptide methionine sulfoxide reductase MsrA